MRTVSIGLIGSGFMGRAHVLALRAAVATFDLPINLQFELLSDISEPIAKEAAARLGFRRATGDWRAVVSDPAVDIVHIATPNDLHFPIALAAIENGKAIHCEKPLATDGKAAGELAAAATAAGITTIVGFNYLKNPIQALAQDLIQQGEIGTPISFRGIHAEDYMADPATPYSWRLDPQGGGVAMDLGSHIVSLALFLLGDVSRVTAMAQTRIAERRDGAGENRPVHADDQCDALLQFESGAVGNIQASWLAQGRQMQLDYEVVGTKGSLAFTQERLNELRLFKTGGHKRTAGFTTVTAGPAHPPYGAFCPAPGHQLAFNDLKTIEMRDFLHAYLNGTDAAPAFWQAANIQQVIDAILASAETGNWVAPKSVEGKNP